MLRVLSRPRRIRLVGQPPGTTATMKGSGMTKPVCVICGWPLRRIGTTRLCRMHWREWAASGLPYVEWVVLQQKEGKVTRRYEVVMSNGDIGEADSILGILTAAATMHEDAEGESFPDYVKINGHTELWITRAARNHVMEVQPRKDGL